MIEQGFVPNIYQEKEYPLNFLFYKPRDIPEIGECVGEHLVVGTYHKELPKAYLFWVLDALGRGMVESRDKK